MNGKRVFRLEVRVYDLFFLLLLFGLITKGAMVSGAGTAGCSSSSSS